MTTYTKFEKFVENLVSGVHNFATDSIKVALSNSAPSASGNTIFSDITEISAGNGYSAGGTASTISLSRSGGTEKVTATDVVFTASGGSIGPFRYIIIYDATPTSPLKPLIGYADYGSSITLASGETFTADFDGSAGLFTVA